MLLILYHASAHSTIKSQVCVLIFISDAASTVSNSWIPKTETLKKILRLVALIPDSNSITEDPKVRALDYSTH